MHKHNEIIVNYVRSNPGKNLTIISNELDISYPSVRKTVDDLINEGILIKRGQRIFVENPTGDINLSIPSALLNPTNQPFFEDIIGLGQAILKSDDEDRKLPNHQTIKQFNKEIQELFEKANPELYYRTLLIQQLGPNPEFFTLFSESSLPSVKSIQDVKNTFNTDKDENTRLKAQIASLKSEQSNTNNVRGHLTKSYDKNKALVAAVERFCKLNGFSFTDVIPEETHKLPFKLDILKSKNQLKKEKEERLDEEARAYAADLKERDEANGIFDDD